MMFTKIIKIFSGIFSIFALAVSLTAISHPIILKWFSTSARIIGRPVKAIVYADGRKIRSIKVFHAAQYWNNSIANYYILYFLSDNMISKRGKIISLNLKDNYVGLASSTNKMDYDIVLGVLFQSEVGSHFTPFGDDTKGYGFDPRLTFTEKQIKFRVPNEFGCDSIRVEL
jgi:hypothetical protein